MARSGWDGDIGHIATWLWRVLSAGTSRYIGEDLPRSYFVTIGEGRRPAQLPRVKRKQIKKPGARCA